LSYLARMVIKLAEFRNEAVYHSPGGSEKMSAKGGRGQRSGGAAVGAARKRAGGALESAA